MKNIKILVIELQHIKSSIDALVEQEKLIKKDIVEVCNDTLQSEYKSKTEPFGVVNYAGDGFKIKFDTPKKVKWDQKGLKGLLDLGAPVKAEYSVSETVFKALDDDGKEAFMPFRTVEPGLVSVRVEFDGE